jgi:hypothetical protein
MSRDAKTKKKCVAWEYEPSLKSKKGVLTATFQGEEVYRDSVDLDNQTARRKAANAVAKRLKAPVEALEKDLQRVAKDAAATRIVPGGQLLRYVVQEDHEDPERRGLYCLSGKTRQLTNFALTIEKDVTIEDELRPGRRFEGTIALHGAGSPFSISAEDFGNDQKLRASIHKAAGAKAIINCHPPELRQAISAVSEPTTIRLTTSFGWNAAGDAYRFPGGCVTANGYHRAGEQDDLQVDLGGEETAQHLRLMKPGSDLLDLKRHVVRRFLRLQDRQVTYVVLAAAALAVLHRFIKDEGRPAIWLKGLTGAGKSFVAKLAMNFFGNFPPGSGRFVSWAATANYIERQGYFFRDALHLVDDFKPEVIPHWQVVRILQTYSDHTSRGRLNADATTKISYPVRGILISTGEDVPEHTASALARSIVIEVPQREKDLERGARCLRRCKSYSQLTAAFIQQFLAEDRQGAFVARFQELKQDFYRDIAGRQNDARIASNVAMLAAAFEEFARFLEDAWLQADQEAEAFLQDLRHIRDAMLLEAHDQQASQVFLATLWDLIQTGAVNVQHWTPSGLDAKIVASRPCVGRAPGAGEPQFLEITTSAALAQVNESLRKQGKPEVKITPKTLIQDLLRAGILVDAHGEPAAAEGAHTCPLRIGRQQSRGFRVSLRALRGFDEGNSAEEVDE